MTFFTFSFRAGKGRTLAPAATRVLREPEVLPAGSPLDKDPLSDISGSM
eukprot:Gb_34635 [translate_table: standard]